MFYRFVASRIVRIFPLRFVKYPAPKCGLYDSKDVRVMIDKPDRVRSSTDGWWFTENHSSYCTELTNLLQVD